MKDIEFFYNDSLISKSLISNYLKKLAPEIKNLNKNLDSGYTNEYGFLNLVDDRRLVLKIINLAKTKIDEDLDALIIVGIGGSNLCTLAVLEAIKGRFYNQLHNSPKIYFVDNVDSCYLKQIIHIMEDTFKSGKKVLINLVTKSGTTTESIANFEILMSVLKKYEEKYSKYVVVTTERDSKLYEIALKDNFEVIEIPKLVPGRYSSFSAVGLFPLAMINVDIQKLVYGAKKIREKCLSLKNNVAAINAIVMYLHYQNKKNIYECLLFSNELEYLGKWYRQLIAESIGKEFDKFGNKVNIGITPSVSVGSNDLHSVFQLYIGGPRDKLIHIISLKNNSSISIPNYPKYEILVNNLQGKSLNRIMQDIINAVKISFNESGVPYTEILLDKKDEFSIGQFLMLKEIEIVLLAYLFNINPFDEPCVEKYKSYTRKLLKK